MLRASVRHYGRCAAGPGSKIAKTSACKVEMGPDPGSLVLRCVGARNPPSDQGEVGRRRTDCSRIIALRKETPHRYPPLQQTPKIAKKETDHGGYRGPARSRIAARRTQGQRTVQAARSAGRAGFDLRR